MSNHSRLQIPATRALIKFLTDHNGDVDPDLRDCLAALEVDDTALAVKHARNVKPHGMGSLTDWFPPAVYDHEDREYVSTVLNALVSYWCHTISLSFPKSEPNSSFMADGYAAA
jgi:hypothetical protein